MSSATDPKPGPVATGYPAAPNGGGAYAYAYPAPPPHAAPYYAAPPPPAYYAPRPRSSTRLLRRLIAVAIAIFLIMGAATLIVWLVLRPRIPEFSISSAAVSGFNLSSPNQQLFADFDLTLSAHNPNEKMRVYYEHLSAAVLYGLDTIAETSLPPFDQRKGETTPLRARMAAVAAYLGDDAFKGITADRSKGDGAVSFHVRVYGWVMFRAGAWRTRRHVMRVYCDDLRIGFKNGTAGVGSLVGPPKQCQVNL